MGNQNSNKQFAVQIEQLGVEKIPAHERTAKPIDVFRISFGGANTFATAVLGAFPVFFGLSFWQGAFAIIIGVIIGALILSPLALFGPLNGTSNAVSSGAHFGVHGRIVGSFLSLLTAVAFFSLSVWSSGDALVGGLHRLVQLPETNLMFAIAYGIFSSLVLIICIYGFRFMLYVNKIAVWSASVMFIIGFFAFSSDFNMEYAGTFTLGTSHEGFWAAFVGATLLAMSNPISFGAFLGDWGRYIPENTPKYKMLCAAFFAQIATLIPFFFGLITATIVSSKYPEFIENSNYVGGLLAISPDWFFLPVCIIALIGGFSTGTTSLYGTGLDISSVCTKLSRVQSTIFIGIASIFFIFIGRFYADLIESVSTFAVLIITCTVPWMIIMTLGYLTRRGYYQADDLQVFTRRQTGGIYWFHNGWNWRGLAAWIPSAILGLLFVNIPGQFVGFLGHLANGVDISVIVGIIASSVFYLTLLFLFPEPADVFGPLGPRWVRKGRGQTQAIRSATNQ